MEWSTEKSLLSVGVRHPAPILGALALAIHTASSGSYDYFSDELYFVVCGRHLAWGYVDQPPLVPFIARVSQFLFDGSLVGLRLVPTLAAGALAALTVEATRRLGGSTFARWLAGLSVLFAPAFLGAAQTLSTDSLQPLAWLAVSVFLLEAIEHQRPVTWYALGVVAAVGFLDKYTIALFLIAAATGLLLTPQRSVLAHRAPWLAALLALIIVMPNLIWQQSNNWPFLEVNRWAFNGRNIAYGPLDYFLQQVLLIGPIAAPIWLAGLLGFAFWRRLAKMRWVFVAWIVLMAIMLLTHGKTYYPAGIYPILLAGGAVVVEAVIPSFWARLAIATAIVLSGAAIVPFLLPVLPVDRFLEYQHEVARLAGVSAKPMALDQQVVGVLPANYASMFGYREMAAAVGRAYQTLSLSEQSRAVFFGRGYSEAAAIDVFGAPWHLPPAISGHNNYFLWGPRGHDGTVVFLFSTASSDALLKSFGPEALVARIGEPWAIHKALLAEYASAEPVAYTDNPYAQPFERHLTLWLCRKRKTSLQSDWIGLKVYR